MKKWAIRVYDEIERCYAANLYIHAESLELKDSSTVIANGAIIEFDEPIDIVDDK